MKKYVGIPNKFFYVPIIILLIYLIIRLINQFQMVTYFPIDAFANDYSGHMAKLFFLAKSGFHQVVPNWYNGTYLLLKFYSPAWYFFALPFFFLTNNVQSATYITLILIYIIGFVFFYYFGKTQNLSIVKRVAFFLFFFVNPIAIGYFLRLGKMPEMFAWLWFILFAMLIFWYKDHNLDWKFLFFIPLYTLLFYSHMLVFLVASFLILSLFIIKKNKERIFIFLSGIVVLILTAPYWIVFMQNISSSALGSFIPLTWIIPKYAKNLTDTIVAFILPVVFWIIFYFYWLSKDKSKKELLFFSLPLLVSILYFTRILVFIPILNRPHPDTYNFFFIFLAIFMVLKIRFSVLDFKIQKLISYSLIIVVILGVIVSTTYTHYYEKHTEEVEELFSLFESINGNFIILKEPNEIHAGAAYSYGAIYYNLSTPSGWGGVNISKELVAQLWEPDKQLDNNSCEGFKDSIKELKVTNVITYDDYCEFLSNCEFKIIDRRERACLYLIA